MKKAKVQPAEYPKVLETYRDIGNYTLGTLRSDKPSCFNGEVSVRRYRVTVELIEEPLEVLRERLQDLWDHSNNMHHYEPLKSEAARLGCELQGRPGSKVKP